MYTTVRPIARVQNRKLIYKKAPNITLGGFFINHDCQDGLKALSDSWIAGIVRIARLSRFFFNEAPDTTSENRDF